MQGVELARIIGRLPVQQPVTDAYQAENPVGTPRPGKNWRNQREHLVGWLRELTGPGAYGRQSRDWDAKAAYSHLQCAPALLWLAEALGEDPDVVEQAVRAVRATPERAASQCAAVRRVIPWSRIEQLVCQQ